jgi:CubicO group peptidase (beta-lactamase class C family)
MIFNKKKKRVWIIIAAILLLGHFILVLSGTSYLYKALLYNFPNLDDYQKFPNAEIPSSSNPQPWPAAIQNYKLSDTLSSYLDSVETKAVLVLRNDTIIFETYFDGYTDTTLSNSFSVAKSIVSTLIGMAIRDGKIKSVDQKVSEFLPEFSSGKKAEITLKHLLTMSSGLNWDESYAAPISTTTEAYYGNDIKKIIDRLEVVGHPGTVFRYKSGDTQILAMVLQNATGKSLAENAAVLWTKIGATEKALWSKDREDGVEKAYCCFNSNARDFARLGVLFLHKGNWKGEQLIDSSYVKEAITPCGLPDGDLNMQPSDFYGYQWWMVPTEGMFYARGILGQYVVVIPEKNLVIVRLGAVRGKKIGKHYQECLSLAREVRRW